MQVFLYYPKQREFLCGYYDEEKFWCGDAEGFAPRRGVDARAFAETCEVRRGGGEASETVETCAEAEARTAVVSEKNAHGESVVMRR